MPFVLFVVEPFCKTLAKKVVEAAGIEPASEITWRKESTCVSGSCLVSPPDIENRQECLATRPVSFAGGSRTAAIG